MDVELSDINLPQTVTSFCMDVENITFLGRPNSAESSSANRAASKFCYFVAKLKNCLIFSIEDRPAQKRTGKLRYSFDATPVPLPGVASSITPPTQNASDVPLESQGHPEEQAEEDAQDEPPLTEYSNFSPLSTSKRGRPLKSKDSPNKRSRKT